MTNREILAELKKSYEYLRDIRENGCIDHCNGQLNAERIKHIENAINELAVVYYDFRKILDDKECMINLKDKGTFYIGKYIDEDYSQLYDDNNNYTYWVTCEDIDYYWYEDKKFIMEEN